MRGLKWLQLNNSYLYRRIYFYFCLKNTEYVVKVENFMLSVHKNFINPFFSPTFLFFPTIVIFILHFLNFFIRHMLVSGDCSLCWDALMPLLFLFMYKSSIFITADSVLKCYPCGRVCGRICVYDSRIVLRIIYGVNIWFWSSMQ
jgi:hypothetical protein